MFLSDPNAPSKNKVCPLSGGEGATYLRDRCGTIGIDYSCSLVDFLSSLISNYFMIRFTTFYLLSPLKYI